LHNHCLSRQGFTLVELSIVLVVIGLLIGGVLIGQGLMESARTVKLINNFRQYEVAFTGFKQKFKQLPGDSNLFNVKGDNNGIIASANNLESMYAVSHLQQAGFLNTNLVEVFSTNWFTQTVPATQVSGTVLEDWGLKGAMAAFYDYKGWIALQHPGNVNPTKSCTYSILYGREPDVISGYNPLHLARAGALTPQQTYSIDKKTDDGKIHTGGFLAYNGSNSPYSDSNSTGFPKCRNPESAPTTDPTAKYNVNLNYKVCVAVYCLTDL
jgi:prepilin-type N-terminal cleavage/methylation domain-containing protein